MKFKSGKLSGRRVAILVDDGFEQVEMTEPVKALEDEGAETFIVSPAKRKVKAWSHTEWGDRFTVDIPLESADASMFNALLLPGGVMNPDKLRKNRKALAFIREFFYAGKPVAAICHAPWTLIDAGVVEGREITSWESLKNDLKNAGAHWVDKAVVVDNGLVTSRGPHDLHAFNRKMVEEFAEGIHYRAREQFMEYAEHMKGDEFDLDEAAGVFSRANLGRALALAGLGVAVAMATQKIRHNRARHAADAPEMEHEHDYSAI
jgi:protease I